jgi:hypothetical protein
MVMWKKRVGFVHSCCILAGYPSCVLARVVIIIMMLNERAFGLVGVERHVLRFCTYTYLILENGPGLKRAVMQILISSS